MYARLDLFAAGQSISISLLSAKC